MERLATGGMAELYKARVLGSHGFQKPVVIKKILPHLAADPSFVSMFIDEANLTARLDHPKIAQVLELGTIDDELFIAMEFVDGRDLLAVLRACHGVSEGLPAHLAVYITHEVLDALDYAHQATDDNGRPLGLVHRDISPSNVLISRRGDVKLTDFGIAHAAQRRQKTEAGVLKGKYHYMSPEQVTGGTLDARSDLFVVGTVLTEMLTGRQLFKAASDLDVLLMVREARIDRMHQFGGHIDEPLKAILLRALARDPAERFPSAGAFRDALADWLFARQQRVGPADLASWLSGLFPSESTPSPIAASSPNLFAATTPPPVTHPRADLGPPDFRARPTERGVPDDGDDGEPQLIIEPDSSKTTPKQVVPMPPRSSSTTPLPAGPPAAAPLRQATPRVPSPSRAPTPNRSFPAPVPAPAPPLRTPTPVSRAPRSEEGDFPTTSPLRLFHRLARRRETGVLVASLGPAACEVSFAGGQVVSAEGKAGGFGEFLVAERLVADGELSLALAMRPHFRGSLGEALVGLGLVTRDALGERLLGYVQRTLVELLAWTQGTWRFERGPQHADTALAIGLPVPELLGAAAIAATPDTLNAWSKPVLSRFTIAVPGAETDPAAFKLGPYPADLLARLTGQLTVRDHLTLCKDPAERLHLLRVLRLLVETELAILS